MGQMGYKLSERNRKKKKLYLFIYFVSIPFSFPLRKSSNIHGKNTDIMYKEKEAQ